MFKEEYPYYGDKFGA